MKKVEQLRVNYDFEDEFNLDQTPKNPFDLFERIFDEYLKLGTTDANAMSISTIDNNGYPDTRQVLLKEVTSTGFIFYTNYNSHKAKAIELNNKVALNFWWKELGYQIRIKGVAKKIISSKSEEYFFSRPKLSQIAAITSNQSSTLLNRENLLNRFEKNIELFENTKISYPENWGGFEVTPISFEFWRGRKNRLHDRILFESNDKKWLKSLLSP